MLKSKRRFAKAVKFENDVYIIGGENQLDGALDSVEKLGDQRWVAKLPKPISRYCAVFVNSRRIKVIYIIGGRVEGNLFSNQGPLL
jgi:hypothetical protein